MKNIALNSEYELKPIIEKKRISKLSRQESLCAGLYLLGYTAKEAAKILGISNRTVEEYLVRAKHKFGVNTKDQLRRVLKKNSLLVDLMNVAHQFLALV